MRTATLIARKAGEEEERRRRRAGEPTRLRPRGGSKAESLSWVPGNAQPVRVETPGAVYEDGRVYLRGNPLSTIKTVLCVNCHLPRFMKPALYEEDRPLSLKDGQFCGDLPPIDMPGVDVHGRPFAVERAYNKNKKRNEAIQARRNGNQNPSLSDRKSATQSIAGSSRDRRRTKKRKIEEGNGDGDGDMAANHNGDEDCRCVVPQKEPVFFPFISCPNCGRYYSSNRAAGHLEFCMG